MSRAKDFLNICEGVKPSKKEMIQDEATKNKKSAKKEVVLPQPIQPMPTTTPDQRMTDEQIQQELSALFAQKSPNFDKVYEKIIKIVERRPMTQRADIYKNLLNMLLKSIVGPSMINRQLFNGARDFWRNLVSGVYYK